MRVFVFGAGFSVAAGYPLGSDLLPRIAEEERTSRVNGRGERWVAFEEWRDAQSARDAAFREIAQNQNPEYILTHLDAACMAAQSRDEQLAARVFDAQRRDSLTEELANEWRNHQSRLEPEATHRRTILDALWSFFGWRHWKDWEQEALWGDGCVLSFFRDCVKDGDVILTFNYDSVAERCLWRLGKWQPSDGYGFRVKLLSPVGAHPDPLPSSLVTILKLHGSVGWLRHRSRVCIERSFLTGLGVYQHDEQDILARMSSSEKAMLLPSFAKVLDCPTMTRLWSRAATALRAASQVIIIGYSLPQADQGAIALLASTLRGRRCPVVVVDPADRTIPIWKRYETVLGRAVVGHHGDLKSWAEAGHPMTTQPTS